MGEREGAGVGGSVGIVTITVRPRGESPSILPVFQNLLGPRVPVPGSIHMLFSDVHVVLFTVPIAPFPASMTTDTVGCRPQASPLFWYCAVNVTDPEQAAGLIRTHTAYSQSSPLSQTHTVQPSRFHQALNPKCPSCVMKSVSV